MQQREEHTDILEDTISEANELKCSIVSEMCWLRSMQLWLRKTSNVKHDLWITGRGCPAFRWTQDVEATLPMKMRKKKIFYSMEPWCDPLTDLLHVSCDKYYVNCNVFELQYIMCVLILLYNHVCLSILVNVFVMLFHWSEWNS